jgi:type IV pilus assembly protein PilB
MPEHPHDSDLIVQRPIRTIMGPEGPTPPPGADTDLARRQTRQEVMDRLQAMEADDPITGRKTRIGERLVALGIISADQLNVALQEKKSSRKLLGTIMVDLGFLDEDTLAAFLAGASGGDVFDPKATIADGDALDLIDKKTALRHRMLPLSVNAQTGEAVVAMADPYDVVALDTLRRFLPKGAYIRPLIATPGVLSKFIDASYGYASSVTDILAELEEGKVLEDVAILDEDKAHQHPIVRLVNALLTDAVKGGVSDLHFEPEEGFVRLRYRLDGALYTAKVLHKKHWNGISQRLKILSEMNIADKINPQDGRIGLVVGGHDIDFRVSCLPTVHGENIVLRVLDKGASIMPLDGLGFSNENMKKIKDAQKKPEGIIIVTGPTGSGKTTSLYSMLNEINDVEVNIQTMEDPVEYSLPMIRQTAIREGVLDFADGIKSLMRQDPDIIFLGEVRDPVTAEMALKAAMTGHQVYTTLHTNDSFGAIPRLLDLGLKPGMIAGAIIAVFAQRLARRLCPQCKEAYTPDADTCRDILDIDPDAAPTLYRARKGGCPACMGKGYKGRVAVAEILTFDEDMNEILAEGGSKAALRKMAYGKGFKDMRYDGLLKVMDGLTSIEALAKVVDVRKPI